MPDRWPDSAIEEIEAWKAEVDRLATLLADVAFDIRAEGYKTWAQRLEDAVRGDAVYDDESSSALSRRADASDVEVA